MEEHVHYNIHITVTKVEHKNTKVESSYGRGSDVVSELKRVVTEAGDVKIKHTDFETAKRLAGAHLDLLTEFTGTDPQRGNSRG